MLCSSWPFYYQTHLPAKKFGFLSILQESCNDAELACMCIQTWRAGTGPCGWVDTHSRASRSRSVLPGGTLSILPQLACTPSPWEPIQCKFHTQVLRRFSDKPYKGVCTLQTVCFGRHPVGLNNSVIQKGPSLSNLRDTLASWAVQPVILVPLTALPAASIYLEGFVSIGCGNVIGMRIPIGQLGSFWAPVALTLMPHAFSGIWLAKMYLLGGINAQSLRMQKP